MSQLVVRDLEEEVLRILRTKAQIHGHPLEDELREILTQQARFTPEEKLCLVDQIRAMSPAAAHSDGAALIRNDRTR